MTCLYWCEGMGAPQLLRSNVLIVRQVSQMAGIGDGITITDVYPRVPDCYSILLLRTELNCFFMNGINCLSFRMLAPATLSKFQSARA